ncbi:hypothetical protein KI811_17690 [Geobacter hydrogenophilus]|uniref:Teneurin-like YD-shell domain-containing protein n=1 Tax=Geobacter hydrogenophilus TaxID=40983 RepID=A0A9W6LBB7_9BACT|nr:RHS repeat-associated core domain-containing protein [Geobacter hydrogenophilus]MBT0895641.1 hypothetical protein [Geobacter hydrogenophilus]GLI36810.1 hypothetical protein GHYDROH2_03110 [Geobacter hydrogenophilus]
MATRTVSTLAALIVGVVISAGTPQIISAKLIGADAPCRDCCGQALPDVPSGKGPCPDIFLGSFTSTSSGTMGETYPVVSARNANGAGLELSLHYASYVADGEKATLNTVMGYGWSHSYNIFLFIQGRDIFKMSPGGLTTKYQRAARGGALTATRGHQQTITENADGSIEIRNNDGLTFRFEKIPGNPITILGTTPWMLKRITDRNDNVTELTYVSGLLDQVEDTYGRKITFAYDSNERLWKITDPLGRSTYCTYDGFRNLASITDPLGNTVRYSYNERHQIIRKTDKDGHQWRYEYNAAGRPTGTVDENGATLFRMTNSSNWATNATDLLLNKQRTYVPSVTTKKDGRGNLWQYHYDKDGLITRVVAPDGASTAYSYDAATLNVKTETDANLHTTTYQYDVKGNRTLVRDHLGNETRYAYEQVFSNVTTVTFPNSAVTKYQYDAKGNRIQETRDVGGLNLVKRWFYFVDGNVEREEVDNVMAGGMETQITRYEYDTYGNRSKVTDPENNVTQYEYDILGNRLKVIDANGHETTYEYDALNRLTRETDPLGYTTEYAYDGNNNRTEVKKQVKLTPPEYQTTRYEYDLRNRLIRETRDPGGLELVTAYTYDGNNNRLTTTDPRGKTTKFEYDVQNRLTTVMDALGSTTQTTYDGVGNRTCAIDANSHYTHFMYDELNRLSQEVKKISIQECTPGDADDIVTQYFYDNGSGGGCSSCGGPTPGSSNIAQIIDPEDKVTCFKYDKIDRRKATIRKVGDTDCGVIDSDDWVEKIDYDSAGNVLTRTDANGNPTVLTYFLNNWLKTEANAEGETTEYTYDHVGNVKTFKAPNGNITTNDYTDRNELKQVVDGVGLVATYEYDGVGNRLHERDGNNNGPTYTYDAANRLVAVTDAMGQTTRYSYDKTGNLTKTTDREGRVTCYLYDDINRRTQMAQLMGGTTCALLSANDIWTRTEYDPVGNVTRLITAKKGSTPDVCASGAPPADCEVTSYIYDEVNRLTVESYPPHDLGKNTREFSYDRAGNLKTRRDQKNRTTTYQYNDLYYLTLRDYEADPDDRFAYDTGGRMLRAGRGGWIVTFEYDKANRVKKTNQGGKDVGYAYDIQNGKRTVSYPGGRVIIEQMDLRQRLGTINDGGLTAIAAYAYDLGNRVETRTYRNGTVATYGYNANNWITSLEHTAGATRIAGFGHDYDREGNKKYEDKRHDTTKSEAYQYDAIYRLIDYKVGNLVGSTIPVPVTQTQYNLDKLGNWDSKVKDGTPQNRTHNAVNEITAIDAVTIRHDDNGNLMEDERYTYAYDEENRLTGVTRKADGRLVGQYRYDALSRRIAKVADPAVGPVETRYFYDDARIIEEQDAGGFTKATYVYGNYIDEVLTMDRGGQPYYYHQNALWSVAAVTNSTANVVERYAYDAYGCVTITDGAGNPVSKNAWGTPHGAIGNPWMFTGRQLDEESGLYYYRARYYDCEKGRFLQRDPLSYFTGINFYEYVWGNSPNLTDPWGLEQVLVTTGTRELFVWGIDVWGVTGSMTLPIKQNNRCEKGSCKAAGDNQSGTASISYLFGKDWYFYNITNLSTKYQNFDDKCAECKITYDLVELEMGNQDYDKLLKAIKKVFNKEIPIPISQALEYLFKLETMSIKLDYTYKYKDSVGFVIRLCANGKGNLRGDAEPWRRAMLNINIEDKGSQEITGGHFEWVINRIHE